MSLSKLIILVALVGTLIVPFLNKPVHIDDANFLMLAEGAALDIWRPHSILINWAGHTEPAYGILSNPPGIAWYLLPVRNCSERIMHLWMLPWLLLAAWGCWKLAVHFTQGSGFYEMLFMLTCPVVVLSTHALTPDLAVFACMCAGVGGYLTSTKYRWGFAILAGSAVLFRYSGGLAIPFLFFIGFRRGGIREALLTTVSAIPVILLVLHDLHAYGEIHLLTMFLNQNDAKGVARTWGNVIAGIAMVGGAGVLPILIWRKESFFGALVGAIIGLSTAYLAEQSPDAAIATILFTAFGVAALSLALTHKVKEPVLSAWAIGGALFFFVVRFAAARYWAAFIPGAALLALRNCENNRTLIFTSIGLNVLLSFLLAVDDQNHARANQLAAVKASQYGTGEFSGHWGWQHYLTQAGWQPLERGAVPSDLYARGTAAGQQNPATSAKLIFVDHFMIEDQWWGPRVHAEFGKASYHSSGGDGFAPWTLSNEPYDQVWIYQRDATNE